MAYYVPSTPPVRGRAYSFSQPSQYYPPTPYSAGNALSIPYTPGVARSGGAAYYVTPTVTGRRSRSHSRARPGHSHHRSHHHHHHHSSHGHSRRSRSQSVGAHRQHHYQRPSGHYSSHRPQMGVTSLRHHHSPSLGSRILSFFGLGNSSRYIDQHGRTVDSRGRTKYKY